MHRTLNAYMCGPWHRRIRSDAVGIVTELRSGETGVRVLVDLKGVAFVKTSVLALGLTQPSIRWVLG